VREAHDRRRGGVVGVDGSAGGLVDDAEKGGDVGLGAALKGLAQHDGARARARGQELGRARERAAIEGQVRGVRGQHAAAFDLDVDGRSASGI
jgi:hypothetical protein